MRRNLIAVLAAALLVVTAGCAGNLTASASPDQSPDDGPDGRTIEVGASGQASADPDQAIIGVAVVTTGDDATTARERLAENVSSMRQALAEMGIDDDQITTTRYDISQDHRRKHEEGGPTTYRALHAFEIVLSDLDRTGDVIDTAVENGATNVDGVRFGLSEDRQRELRNQALEDAMANARTQADTLAASADLSVTGVHSASTVENGYRPYMVETAAAGANGDSTSIDTGPVTVQVTVQVTYNASA